MSEADRRTDTETNGVKTITPITPETWGCKNEVWGPLGSKKQYPTFPEEEPFFSLSVLFFSGHCENLNVLRQVYRQVYRPDRHRMYLAIMLKRVN